MTVPAAGPVLVIVGAPGSGKSTVGSLVAERLGVGFRDTDVDIETAAGTTVADIFVQQGEPEFRDLERSAVAAALAGHSGVLALGGGAVGSAEIRNALAGRAVVYLEVGLADALSRLGMNRDRPLLVGNLRGRWLGLMQQRRPLYEEVATWQVATDGRSVADVADEVVRLLEGRAV